MFPDEIPARRDKMVELARRTMSDERETMSARHDRIERPVETMMTADGLRLAAYGPDENEMRIVEDLPKED
jgi:hypothetical protein